MYELFNQKIYNPDNKNLIFRSIFYISEFSHTHTNNNNKYTITTNIIIHITNYHTTSPQLLTQI